MSQFNYRTEIHTVPMVLTEDVLREIAEHVGGFTLTYAQGGYVMDDGMLIIEPSAILTIVTNGQQSAKAVIGMVQARAREEGEESILVSGPYAAPSALVYTHTS